jgi:hypothetical protein
MANPVNRRQKPGWMQKPKPGPFRPRIGPTPDRKPAVPGKPQRRGTGT